MRLWHEKIISKLPRQQLLGQHRECCALRGNSWGKSHATVNYVFDYPYYYLYAYHLLIIKEMEKRGYKPDSIWKDSKYRGKKCSPFIEVKKVKVLQPIYPEHNDNYYNECIDNLFSKKIIL